MDPCQIAFLLSPQDATCELGLHILPIANVRAMMNVLVNNVEEDVPLNWSLVPTNQNLRHL